MLNRIIIQGRLTKDPELRSTQSGVNVASFTVAVERDYQSGGSERQTDFIDCVAWRATGEFVSKYFRKGQLIVVDGRLQSRRWEDRDGNKRTSWEINADSVYFGEPKRDESKSDNYGPPQSSSGNQYATPTSSPSNSQQQTFHDLPDEDDDLPINGDSLDNRAENLEWIPLAENIKHGFHTGLYDNIQKPVVLSLSGAKVEFPSMSSADSYLNRSKGYTSQRAIRGYADVVSRDGTSYQLSF